MKRLHVKQCHTETTKTASTSVDIRPTCVYCEIIRNRSSSFFKKMLVLKMTNLPDTCHSHTVTNSGQT